MHAYRKVRETVLLHTEWCKRGLRSMEKFIVQEILVQSKGREKKTIIKWNEAPG